VPPTWATWQVFITALTQSEQLTEAPTFDWVVAFGGTGNCEANDMAYSGDDSLYVAGTFRGTLTMGANITLTNAGDYDSFVARQPNPHP